VWSATEQMSGGARPVAQALEIRKKSKGKEVAWQIM
jgi:hypothetical protein